MTWDLPLFRILGTLPGLGGRTADSPALVLSLAPLVMLLAWAAVLDWRHRTIPNWLTFSLLLGGLARGVVGSLGAGDGFTLVEALSGAAAGFAVGVPLMAIGARGGGDAKLYISAGAWLGVVGVLVVFVLEAVIGMIIVIAQTAARGTLLDLLRSTGVLVLTCLQVRRIGVAQAQANGIHFTSIDRRLPHAVPFLAALMLALVLWMQRWQ